MRDIKVISLNGRVCISNGDFDKLMNYLERTAMDSNNERNKTVVAELFIKLVGADTYNPDRELELANQQHKKYIDSAKKLLNSI